MPELAELCGCGKPLHYTNADIERQVRAFIAELGEYQPITIPDMGTWLVQRHYIALHGIRARDLPGSQWEKIK